MRIGRSIEKAIDEWEAGDFESAMLHACNAIDGTAKKAHPGVASSNARFTMLLRQNYASFGPMGAPGIDLTSTRFPVKVERPKATGGKPDIADVIYGIHRCCHGHGQALPAGFDLQPDALSGSIFTTMIVEKGRVRLSDRVIFGLVGVAVTAPENSDERTSDGYYLTLGATHRFTINEWWGRRLDFEVIALGLNLPSVTMDFGDWMDE